MTVRIFLEPGTEKWSRWAKKKLADLSSMREQFGLPMMSKFYVPEAGTLIWIKSSRWGEWIRITGGGGGVYGYARGAGDLLATISDDKFFPALDSAVLPQNAEEVLRLVRYLKEHDYHATALLLAKERLLDSSAAFQLAPGLGAFAASPPDITIGMSISNASAIVIGQDDELYAMWVKQPIPLSGANAFWGEEPAPAVLNAGKTPFLVGVRKLVPNIFPSFAVAPEPGWILDARPFVSAGAPTFSLDEVGFTYFNDGGGNIIPTLSGVSSLYDPDVPFPNTTAMKVRGRACGAYAVPDGMVVFGVKTDTVGRVLITGSFDQISWSGVTLGEYCAKLTVVNPTTLGVVETYPAQTLHTVKSESDFADVGQENFDQSTYSATSADWLDHSGRVVMNYADSGGVITIYANPPPASTGTVARTISIIDPAVTLLTNTGTAAAPFFEADYPFALFGMLDGRAAVTRKYSDLNAFSAVDTLYVDGVQVGPQYTMTGPPAAPQVGRVDDIPSFNAGNGDELKPLNGTAVWRLVGPGQNLAVPFHQHTIFTNTYRMFRAPSPYFQVNSGALQIWGEAPFLQSNEQWYSFCVLPTELVPPPAKPAEPATEPVPTFLIVHAVDDQALILTVGLQDPLEENAPSSSVLFSRLKDPAVTLPTGANFYNHSSHLLFNADWQAMYASFFNFGFPLTTWAERTALREQLLTALTGIKDAYTASFAGLEAAVEDADATQGLLSFATLWDPIRASLRALFGQYHTVAYSTVSDADSLIKAWFSGQLNVDRSIPAFLSPRVLFPDWKAMYRAPLPAP